MPGWLVCVSWCFGGHSVRETPGYIPNPEAKPFSADGTAGGTLWESRTPPNNLYSSGPPMKIGGPELFCVVPSRDGLRDKAGGAGRVAGDPGAAVGRAPGPGEQHG